MDRGTCAFYPHFGVDRNKMGMGRSRRTGQVGEPSNAKESYFYLAGDGRSFVDIAGLTFTEEMWLTQTEAKFAGSVNRVPINL